MYARWWWGGLFALLCVVECAALKWGTLSGDAPLIIGHRGDPYYVPGHTLASYSIAINEGADYVEPDLVLTKDGVLVCRHEPWLSKTTDVADHPEFADRRKTKTLEQENLTVEDEWWVDDFTLAELQQLKAKQRVRTGARDSSTFDGLFRIPTFADFTEFVQKRSQELYGDPFAIGVIPELKHPTYFSQISEKAGRSKWHQAAALFQQLSQAGYVQPSDTSSSRPAVIIQSFEKEVLQHITHAYPAPVGSSSPQWLLMQLIGVDNMILLTHDGVRNLTRYADLVGPPKKVFFHGPERTLAEAGGYPPAFTPADVQKAGGWIALKELLPALHRSGIKALPYTFRVAREDPDVALSFGGDVVAEYMWYFEIGIDGVFSEYLSPALTARALIGWNQGVEHEAEPTSASSLVPWVLFAVVCVAVLILVAVLGVMVAKPHWVAKMRHLSHGRLPPPKQSDDDDGLLGDERV